MSQSEAQMLRELQEAIASLPNSPRTREPDGEEQVSLSKRGRPTSPAKRAAIEAEAKVYAPLGNLIRRLGDAGYEPAIPLLARLWCEHKHKPLRVDTGHALFKMKTEEARGALESMIGDDDHLSRFLGIRAVFEHDPDRAYDYFEPRFRNTDSESRAVAWQVLHLFVPTGVSFVEGKRTPRWTETRAPSWLKQDLRWLDLCARLRKHDFFGAIARSVLRHADPDDTAAALHRARIPEPPTEGAPRSTRVGNLLARYNSGAFEAVWRDIRSLGKIEGDLRDEVLVVAEETMRRVARNADLIAERLRTEGWRALMDKLRTLPSACDARQFDRIVSITGGPLPPSLHAFWTIVGGIDWVWNYKCDQPRPDLGVGLPMDEMDPLCVDAASVVGYLFEEWEEQRNQPDPDLVDPFRLALAPDYLHKANISGGAPYTIELPFLGADPIFAYERHGLPFIDYLRLSFRWAGFPGLEEHGDREDVQRFVGRFCEGLEPF